MVRYQHKHQHQHLPEVRSEKEGTVQRQHQIGKSLWQSCGIKIDTQADLGAGRTLPENRETFYAIYFAHSVKATLAALVTVPLRNEPTRPPKRPAFKVRRCIALQSERVRLAQRRFVVDRVAIEYGGFRKEVPSGGPDGISIILQSGMR